MSRLEAITSTAATHASAAATKEANSKSEQLERELTALKSKVSDLVEENRLLHDENDSLAKALATMQQRMTRFSQQRPLQ